TSFGLALHTFNEERPPKAEDVAQVVGAAVPAELGVLNGLQGYQAAALYQTAAYHRLEKELAPVVEHERKQRAPGGAALGLLGRGGCGGRGRRGWAGGRCGPRSPARTATCRWSGR